jgi:hypothetical protein
MTDQERAIAEAREQGKAEAVKAAGAKIAAAEFRAAAAGRLANPDGALELIDLSRLVDDNGDPNREAINEAIGRLAAVPPPPAPGGRVPAGPREPAADGDFLRSHWTPRRLQGYPAGDAVRRDAAAAGTRIRALHEARC